MRAIVGDDAIRDPELAHEALDELDCRPYGDGADNFPFCPLGELVDGDVEVTVAPRHSRERDQDVQPPDHERPREWDSLEALSRLVDLLGMELAGLAGSDQLGAVVERRRPVELDAEHLSHEGALR